MGAKGSVSEGAATSESAATSRGAVTSEGTAAGRGGAPSVRRVVVGVDASEASRRALAWALRYARGKAARVLVVHAWHLAEEYVWLPHLPPPADPTEVAREGLHRLVADVVGETGATDVDVDVCVSEGHAAKVLADASRGAELLVVGSRGHGGFDGLTIGSVTGQCAAHAACTVVIVRPEPSEEAAEP